MSKRSDRDEGIRFISFVIMGIGGFIVVCYCNLHPHMGVLEGLEVISLPFVLSALWAFAWVLVDHWKGR